ncbi:MAG: S1C family serine protease [Patescibacteria group bacterium]
MKSKMSPTSPKVQRSDREISEMYRENLSTIDKPQHRKNGSQIWLLLVVVILGFMAGVISQFVLLSYGQNIPFLSKIGIFDGTTQIFTFTGQKSSPQTAQSLLLKTIDEIAPSVVGIYQPSTQNGDMSGLLLAGDKLGEGLSLTEDGYIVTIKGVINDREDVLAVTTDGSVLKVESMVPDPASDFIFLKTTGTRLSVVPFATQESIQAGQEVILLSAGQTAASSAVRRNYISEVRYRDAASVDTILHSSDAYDEKLSLSIYSNQNLTSVVFSETGEAVGIMESDEISSTVTPFWEIIGHLNTLVNDSIVQPVLGVTYIDLSEEIGLSDSLTHGLMAGALIYSTDEKNSPSVKLKSPAQKAGLQKGDIITAVDGQALTTVVNLNSLVLSKKVGDTITVEYNRKNIEKELKITLGSS